MGRSGTQVVKNIKPIRMFSCTDVYTFASINIPQPYLMWVEEKKKRKIPPIHHHLPSSIKKSSRFNCQLSYFMSKKSVSHLYYSSLHLVKSGYYLMYWGQTQFNHNLRILGLISTGGRVGARVCPNSLDEGTAFFFFLWGLTIIGSRGGKDRTIISSGSRNNLKIKIAMFCRCNKIEF